MSLLVGAIILTSLATAYNHKRVSNICKTAYMGLNSNYRHHVVVADRKQPSTSLENSIYTGPKYE